MSVVSTRKAIFFTTHPAPFPLLPPAFFFPAAGPTAHTCICATYVCLAGIARPDRRTFRIIQRRHACIMRIQVLRLQHRVRTQARVQNGYVGVTCSVLDS